MKLNYLEIMISILNGGRFRVTRTGVPAYGRGPVTGVTVDHGSTTSVMSNSGVIQYGHGCTWWVWCCIFYGI